MELLVLLINLAGAAVLLLWAVRMVRSGVEKINGGEMRRLVPVSYTHLTLPTTPYV